MGANIVPRANSNTGGAAHIYTSVGNLCTNDAPVKALSS